MRDRRSVLSDASRYHGLCSGGGRCSSPLSQNKTLMITGISMIFASRSRLKLAAVTLGVLCFGLFSCGDNSREGFELIEMVSPPTRTGLQAWTESSREHPSAPESHVQLLIAARTLRDPIFGRSVILLLEHSPQGAIGLMINRPTVDRTVGLVGRLIGL